MQIFPIILFLIACKLCMSRVFPVGIYLLRRRSGVFIAHLEHVIAVWVCKIHHLNIHILLVS